MELQAAFAGKAEYLALQQGERKGPIRRPSPRRLARRARFELRDPAMAELIRGLPSQAWAIAATGEIIRFAHLGAAAQIALHLRILDDFAD